MVENVNDQMPSHESSGNIPQRDWLFWMVYISTMHVIDFYMTSLVSGRLGSQSVTRLAKLTVVITSLIFRLSD